MPVVPPPPAPRPITLLTDFGTADYFVAAMKGVILTALPHARIVDVSHHIAPQDVRAGAFTLLCSYPAFPPGSVHVAVVDPGVGSDRRAIVMEAGGHLFVGPDNGLFSYVLEREPGARAFHLTRDAYFLPASSSTFHGRDVFAPVAAALAGGEAPDALGVEIHDPVRLPPLRPRPVREGVLEGAILHVDRFGNCITSFTRLDLPDDPSPGHLRLVAAGGEIRSLRRFYEDGAEGEVFAIWGSAGFLEVSVRRGSASERLGLRSGDAVHLFP